MSDGFYIEVADDLDRLGNAAEVLRTSTAGVAEVLAVELLDEARALASGEVLSRRSGTLVESLDAEVRVGAGGFVARLTSDAPYAAILEYGGEIPAHEIRPVDGKALKVRGSAGEVFAAAVHMPEVHMPEHPFMEIALDAMADDIRSRLVAAVRAGVDRL